MISLNCKHDKANGKFQIFKALRLHWNLKNLKLYALFSLKSSLGKRENGRAQSAWDDNMNMNEMYFPVEMFKTKATLYTFDFPVN